ncbi:MULTISPECIES: hypothetical protein [unclassified Chelatococcus]|uniref:hypothetical protein n=1 Tax=unclassified Chelatococcus TaxID=2638111 RepID=UPI00037D72CE|nr:MULTISPECIES: hypothetical protein [unclassified Chelatococcus]ALA16439.1 hypothetical protein AL346_02235 [Chelatococcus sp. CO-6]
MPSGSQTFTATLRRPRKQFWRDVLIFALLGPVFGLVTALWGIPLAFIATGSRIFHAPAPVDLGVLKFLPLGYYIGLLPALVAGSSMRGSAGEGSCPRFAWPSSSSVSGLSQAMSASPWRSAASAVSTTGWR